MVPNFGASPAEYKKFEQSRQGQGDEGGGSGVWMGWVWETENTRRSAKERTERDVKSYENGRVLKREMAT